MGESQEQLPARCPRFSVSLRIPSILKSVLRLRPILLRLMLHLETLISPNNHAVCYTVTPVTGGEGGMPFSQLQTPNSNPENSHRANSAIDPFNRPLLASRALFAQKMRHT